MTYFIVGAGAIGGTIGAHMIRAGEDVVFVDADAAHVQAINARGLTIRGYAEELTVPARAIAPAEVPASIARVIMAVKALHTDAALAQIAPKLAQNGFILSAQNGLNEISISKAVGSRRTIGCFVNFSADYLEPGLIHFGGPGAFYIGSVAGKGEQGIPEETLALVHRDLGAWNAVDREVRITDNIWGYLWGKLGYGAVLCATATSNETMADAIDAYRPLMAALGREVVAVADAEGVTSLGFDGWEPDVIRGSLTDHGLSAACTRMFDALVARRRRDAKTHSGIWRDLAVRKRKTEMNEQLGPIVARGQTHAIATPILARVLSMIGEIERGQRALARENLDELARLTVL